MLRRLTLDDLDAFRALRAEALREHPESFGSVFEQQGGAAQEEAYRRWLSGDLWGAFEDGALVGLTGFYIEDDARTRHTGHIYSVFMRAASRGKGLGDALIKQILAVAEPRVDQVFLGVITTAQAALALYRRNGFEIYGTTPRLFVVNGVAYDEHLMVKKFR